MKICIPKLRLAVLPLAVAAACPSYSQPQSQLQSQPQAVTQLGETVVTAARTDQRADQLVSDVSVITRADIEKSAGRTLPEILARSPGLQFSASGGLGKLSSVSIRGTESRHAILLVDGVRYGSATTGAPNWDTIPVDMIERIEILRGPASALYGSEAVGGVVQVFLRKGAPGLQPYASLTLGSYAHRQVSAGLSGSSGAVSYSLGLQKVRETGFSVTNAKAPFGNFNPDRDGFNQDAVNAALAWQLHPDWKLDAGVLAADSTVQTDDGPNRDARYKGKTSVARLGLEGKLLAGWTTRLRYAQSVDSSRAIEASFMPSLFKTTQNQLTWQNDVDTPVGLLLAGVEQLQQKVDSTTAYTVNERTVNSYFAGLNGNAGPHSWQANVRRDENSQFGGSSTGFGGYGYAISPAWRVNASYGTSFVAPSFNQLYFPNFGNANLQPERGRNTDLGVTWSDAGHTLKLVRFDNKIRGFISNTTIASNIPRARIDGYSLSYNGAFGPLSLHASADVLRPRNELTAKRLARRSDSVVAAGADYAAGLWTFGGSLLHAGESFDNSANTVVLASRTTADLYADYAVSKDWRLQTRLNNLTNKQYETVYGYNQPGRTLYVTLRYQPRL